MHNEYKKQSPYRGFWVILFFLIMVPFGLFSVVKAVLDEYSRYSPELDMATAKALGCGFGFLFHMVCVFSGVLDAGWDAVKYRLREFVENLIVGPVYALRTYLEDMRDDGVTFIIYLAVILGNLSSVVGGAQDAFALLTK